MKLPKNLISLLIALSLVPRNQQACDICGCGVGGGYLGVLPQFQKNLMGLRYFQSSFHHPATLLNTTDGQYLKTDLYHSADLWLRYYMTEKLQVFTFLPYKVNVRSYENGYNELLSGVGDIQLNALHQVINQGADPTKLLRHIWFLGGGVKLPTGKYMQRDSRRRMFPLPIQVGTGAWSFLLQNMYILRFKNFGFQTDVQYRYQLANELQYKMGNTILAGGSAFYWWQVSPHMAVLPIIGGQFESLEKDTEYGYAKENTGGKFGLLTAGVDVYYQKMIFQLFGQLPLVSSVQEAQPSVGTRFGVGVALFW
ncbi:hypothetical protein [Thermaurantimonas aggregans]|uniref:hypothetical protein n=1 Tax=Thermaurantimonas aggregans TaxID=2173829 RepID=UPI0023F27E1A|nr:hypothetical protein [Thermaurantimonas aggregans]MCX8149806.1 hypothetical protein [Thermaurantimonas aggregans]